MPMNTTFLTGRSVRANATWATISALPTWRNRPLCPVQVQWTLLDGINDSDDELDGIVRLLAGKYMVLNLIPYNTVDGLDFQRPSRDRAAEMARQLHRRGVLTKLRQSAGQDVEGGCGQLRARAISAPGTPATPGIPAPAGLATIALPKSTRRPSATGV